jgi:hypothetical protein
MKAIDKPIDRATVIQHRDFLVTEYVDMRKAKNPNENFEVMEVVLSSNIALLSRILGDTFDPFTGRISKIFKDNPDKMYTKSVE